MGFFIDSIGDGQKDSGISDVARGRGTLVLEAKRVVDLEAEMKHGRAIGLHGITYKLSGIPDRDGVRLKGQCDWFFD